MKRDRKTLICMNDDELQSFDNMVLAYNKSGFKFTKSAVVRFALSRLPVDPFLLGLPFLSKVRASNTAL